jgi:hypothetical protein
MRSRIWRPRGELRLSLWLSFFGFFSLSAWTICFAPPASTTSPIAEAKRSRDMFILHRNSGDLDWLLISLFITMFFHPL